MLAEWTSKYRIGNQDGIYFIRPGCCNYNGNGIITVHDGNSYIIKLDGDDGWFDGQETLDGVISTFKFTDQNSPTPTP